MSGRTVDELFTYVSEFYKAVDAKLNFMTASVAVLRDHMTQLYGLDCNVQEIPNASGHLRLKQMACLKLLREMDAVLQKNGVQYWLGYGNLLGAKRTGDFIPWDDDIDICLMRDDFNRAIGVLEENFNHGLYRTQWGMSGGLFKVVFCNHICVDLFPWDFYYKRMDGAEVEQFVERYVQAMDLARVMELDKKMIEERALVPNAPPYIPQSKYDGYDEIRDDLVMQGNVPDAIAGDIFEGIDWQTYPERIARFYHSKPFRNEWIFPLGEIEFCGYKFPAPNNVDAWLTTRFGDWMAFKPDFARHNSKGFDWEELQIIQAWVNGK